MVSKYKLPDVSFWQDDPTTPVVIDFNQMVAQTCAVIIRAGQGSFSDKVFKTSWVNAKTAGLLRGSYWFYDSRAHPKRQAEKWAETLAGDLGEMELWCDFEERYGGTFGGWRNWYDFMENLKVLLPNKPLGVYTGYYYWQEFAAGVNYFGQYPLWIAAYGTDKPRVPPIWKTWLLHQFTDDYPSAGWGAESQEIDMNYFAGTEEDFRARYNLPTTNKRHMTVKIQNRQAEYKEA